MDIAGYIYEGIVEPCYKQFTRKDATCDGYSIKNREESTSSHTYSEISEIARKCRKIYRDHPKGESKISLIHFPGNSSDEYKVLGEFGSKYVKILPTIDLGHSPVPRNNFNKQKDNNDIANSAVDEILLHEN